MRFVTGLLCLVFVACGWPFGASADLVKIPSGEIRAVWLSNIKSTGDKKKLPIFRVRSFLMMAKAVTQEEFSLFLKKNPEWSAKRANRLYIDESYLDGYELSEETKQMPMTSISWFAAKAYCESTGMRLPTVNEWEYVAAASEFKKDANKNPKFLKRILSWYGEPRSGQLKRVGSIYKNVYGVWDMHGLIWEWVEDFNSSFVTGESRQDGSLNKDMFCGAGAISFGDKENYAAFMRFAFRSSLKGNNSVWNLGFRCVRDL
jgi:formylglycine-generating enzyme required for sulfatase activity